MSFSRIPILLLDFQEKVKDRIMSCSPTSECPNFKLPNLPLIAIHFCNVKQELNKDACHTLVS